MSESHAKSSKNYHLVPLLIFLGVAIWLVPFLLVAIDNASGNTKPADYVINHAGVMILIIGPLLVIAGIILLVVRTVKHLRR